MWWFLVELIIGGLTFALVYCIWLRLQAVQITAEDDRTSRVAEQATASSGSVLADRLDKLDAATQGWRRRVGPSDATQFSVAGRMMVEHAASSPVALCGEVTVTPPLQLLGQTSAERTRRTPRAERFRSRVGE
jgi:hypothetical protein